MEHFTLMLLESLESLWYVGIFILMAMESSIMPVPSELVMIPAGISAMSGSMNPYLATLIGGLGSVVWALVNYWILGRWLGKPFLEKYGKYILITPKKYRKTEDLFLSNSYIYTFVGRFIPVVRHLISIPAGIFAMRMVPFVLLTFVWATLWCGILVALGYFFWADVIDIVSKYGHELTYIIIPLCAVYLWWKIFRKK